MPSNITWTNKSVLAFAGDADPIDQITKSARELVLSAFQKGWKGPPFNPIQIAEMLDAKIVANSGISDARLITDGSDATIEFNLSLIHI